MIRVITSRANPRVKTLAAEMESLLVFEGEKLVMDLVARKVGIRILVVNQKMKDRIREQDAEEVWQAGRPVLEKLSRLRSAPDFIAVVRAPRNRIPLDSARSILVLDRIQDPANAGAALRCAAAFGIDAVAFTGDGVRPENPKLIRAAQTAILDVPFRTYPSLEDLLNRSGARRFNVYMTAASGEGESLSPIEIKPPCMVVVGHEGKGLEDRWLSEYPVIRIPQTQRVESLNAGVSACILMYEIQCILGGK